MTPDLPVFRYHPDPMATGSVESSMDACGCCGGVRGVVYRGPVYAEDESPEVLCPWCIADGTAADRFAAEFTDVGFGVPDDVPSEVVDIIASRTPGFLGWQQEHWLYHCGDGAAFLGRVGYEGLAQHPDALQMVRDENAPYGWTESEMEAYLESLSADGDATAYLFRCLTCGRHLAYSDMS